MEAFNLQLKCIPKGEWISWEAKLGWIFMKTPPKTKREETLQLSYIPDSQVYVWDHKCRTSFEGCIQLKGLPTRTPKKYQEKKDIHNILQICNVILNMILQPFSCAKEAKTLLWYVCICVCETTSIFYQEAQFPKTFINGTNHVNCLWFWNPILVFNWYITFNVSSSVNNF